MTKNIENLESYVKEITETYNPCNSCAPKKHLFFRGHNDKDYKLIPSVFRHVKGNNFYKEKDIVKDFIHYAPQHNIHYNFIDERDKMLADMQHQGIPTRLLDWTLAPLNALFFACEENLSDFNKDEDKKDKKDGQVIIFDPWKYWEKLNIDKTEEEIHKIHILSRALLSGGWSFSEIFKYISEKFKYEKLKPEDLIKPFAYISSYTNDRILHQRGAFTIHGLCHEDIFFIPEANECIKTFNIKAEKKKEILNELNCLYINHYSIFPDFEGMQNMIKRTGSLFNIKYF